MTSSLLPFFNPRGVAIVGASADSNKLGYGVARNLIQSQYHGAVHLVNPKGGKIMGRPVFTSLAEVPDPVDLAVLIVPATVMPNRPGRLRYSWNSRCHCDGRRLSRDRTGRRSTRRRDPSNCQNEPYTHPWTKLHRSAGYSLSIRYYISPPAAADPG